MNMNEITAVVMLIVSIFCMDKAIRLLPFGVNWAMVGIPSCVLGHVFLLFKVFPG